MGLAARILVQAQWNREVGSAGGLGSHTLDGSFWAGRKILMGGLGAALHWPPLHWHLWLRLGEEWGHCDCCWGCCAIIQGVFAQGLAGPGPAPMLMAPMRLVKTSSWNVVGCTQQSWNFRP